MENYSLSWLIATPEEIYTYISAVNETYQLEYVDTAKCPESTVSFSVLHTDPNKMDLMFFIKNTLNELAFDVEAQFNNLEELINGLVLINVSFLDNTNQNIVMYDDLPKLADVLEVAELLDTDIQELVQSDENAIRHLNRKAIDYEKILGLKS